MPPESADKVLDALLTCDADFFSVLEDEKAAFGRSAIQSLAYNLLDAEEPRVAVVTFSKPVEAHGLHLLGYVQQKHLHEAGVTYTWGFHATERPADVVRVIEARHPDKVKFSQYHDSWRQEIATTSPSGRSLMIGSSRGFLPGASLYCDLTEETGTAEELPDAFDLFLSQSTGTKFAQRLGAFVVSLEKTFSDFAWPDGAAD